MSRPTLEDPGECSACGRERVAVVSVDVEGRTRASVACLRCSRMPPPGLDFAVSVDRAGKYRVHHGSDGPFEEKFARALGAPYGLLARVVRNRANAKARKVLGRWRVTVDGGSTFAPRPPGALRGEHWPMKPGILRKSKWSRTCVECRADLKADDRVFRADAKAHDPADRHKVGWSAMDIRTCIVCVACVEKARDRSRSAAQVADGILAELLEADS